MRTPYSPLGNHRYNVGNETPRIYATSARLATYSHLHLASRVRERGATGREWLLCRASGVRVRRTRPGAPCRGREYRAANGQLCLTRHRGTGRDERLGLRTGKPRGATPLLDCSMVRMYWPDTPTRAPRRLSERPRRWRSVLREAPKSTIVFPSKNLSLTALQIIQPDSSMILGEILESTSDRNLESQRAFAIASREP